MSQKGMSVGGKMDSSIGHPLKIFDLAKDQGRFLYVSAPMVRYSKLAFRQTVHSYGVDLCWTPMILAKEFNRNEFARDSDLTLATDVPQPPTIVQFGSNSPLEFARASSLVAPFTSGVDLNCGCPQSWACAETLGAALMDRRELVHDMVVAARSRLAADGWAVNLDADKHDPKGRSVSVKIRVHADLRRTMDFIDTVLGDVGRRDVDFLTIHPRTRRTPSSDPIDVDSLRILVDKYGDMLPILVSGDVFTLSSLPFTSPLVHSPEPPSEYHIPKLAGLMSARAILANPAMFHPDHRERCGWDVVERFMGRMARAPLPFKLALHHVAQMTGPGMGPDKSALLSRRERAALQECEDMLDLIELVDETMTAKRGVGLRRFGKGGVEVTD